jgi:hypothetical protein
MLTIFQFFATKTDASVLRMLNGSPAGGAGGGGRGRALGEDGMCVFGANKPARPGWPRPSRRLLRAVEGRKKWKAAERNASKLGPSTSLPQHAAATDPPPQIAC